MRNSKSAGFTLIELLLVISIIGLLSSIVFAATNEAKIKSRDAQRTLIVRQIKNALELYKSDHDGALPAIAGTCTLASNCYCIGIATYSPNDPTTNPLGGACWDPLDNGGSASTRSPKGDITIDKALSSYFSSLPRDPIHNESTVMGDGFIININDHLTGAQLGANVYSLDWGLEGCYIPAGSAAIPNSQICLGGTLAAFSPADGRPFLGSCKNICVLKLDN